MARRLELKLRDSPLPAQVVRARAEELPFEDQSFDYAVSTLVLCTVDDPERAVKELHRLLKPGGQLLFIEHVRSQEARLARWQDRLNGLMIRVGHGCNCNRRTLDNINHAGLPITELTHDELRKDLPICRPLIVGAADRP
jgi:ubiquinone/menaquinone biosynthesis C-methylase UbiE